MLNIKIIVFVILGVNFLYNLLIWFLQRKSINNKTPEELIGIYNENEYIKWKNYMIEKYKLNIVSLIINLLVILVLIYFDFFALISKEINNEYLSSFVVLLSYMFISGFVGLPFEYINIMKIEEKYGFNKTTKKTFIVDQIKGLIISLILGLSLISAYIFIYNLVGDYILIIFTIFIIVIFVFMAFISPLLMKIMNKFVPLSEGDLKNKLVELLNKNDYLVKEIRVMDGSTRTTKVNANISGIGKMKTITLYDTLLDVVTEDEIVAIFAHELGHGKKKHIIKQVLLNVISIFIFVLLSWVLIKYNVYKDFGFDTINYGFIFFVMLELIMPVFSFFSFIPNWYSRKCEYEADKFAADSGYKDELISGLKKVSKSNFSEMSPNDFVVFMKYSHPPLKDRIKI